MVLNAKINYFLQYSKKFHEKKLLQLYFFTQFS
jgi:hypothetical protein